MALTRARDRLLLTATKDSGGGVELLAPGFEALGLACEALPHDPALSLYPPLPEPEAVATPPQGEALWSRSPEALGRYARYVEAKDQVPGGRPAPPGTWDEVLAWAAELYEAWLPHPRALQNAGVDTPHPDSIGRELTAAGAATPYPAVAVWARAGREVALVDAAVPSAAFDQELARFDPAAPPEEAVARVRGALAGVPCAS